MSTRTGRIFSIAISLLLILSVGTLFAGGRQEAGSKDEVKSIIIGGGGAGGSWYLLGAQISELLKKEMPDVAVSVVEGGAISNVRLTDKGRDMDIGIASLPNILDALNQESTFAEDNITDVAPIINFATDYVQFTTLASLDIDGIEDLADKTVLPGPKGWGIEALTSNILEKYGLSYEKIRDNGGEVSFVSWGEAPSLLKDGHAHMAAFKGTYPNANVLEIDATNKAKIISLREDVVQEYVDNHNGYFKGTIPEGTYRGQDEDALTIGHTSVLFANKNLPEDFIYQLTKILMENQEKLRTIEGVTLGKEPLLGIDAEILHPGARKYYEEAGLLD
jgi:hypothetical protein